MKNELMLTDNGYQQLMKHACRLAQDGHGELAQHLRDAIDLRARIDAAPAAPQQAEPVAQIGWADEFGNLFPMGAWKPAQRTYHDSHKAAWRPVFLHPARRREVQRLRIALEKIELEANQPYIQRIAAEALALTNPK